MARDEAVDRLLRPRGLALADLLDEARGPAVSGGAPRLVLLRTSTEGPHPEFCSYRNRRGKRCDQRARWRERDGALGYCTAHRASAGLDDPAA